MTTNQPSNQDLIRSILEIQQETAVRQAETLRSLDELGAKLNQEREERLVLAEQLERDRQDWRSGIDDTINLVSQGITQLGNKIDALGDKIERLIQVVTGYQGNGQ